jgi:amidase
VRHTFAVLALIAAALAPQRQTQPPPRPAFEVAEADIASIRRALDAGEVTSRQLVERYLARIAAYDQAGPRINAFVSLNPKALETADAMDRARANGGARGKPLHGIPLVIKDNYDTADMPTTGSSIALATLQPSRDAYLVEKLREAGAIIIGKTNLHELAAGILTVSSLGGQTRNPYDPTRNPGGSSGGTGAAIAAGFGAAGLGSDTCGSIRLPAAHNSLVGLRPSVGLTSGAGIIPLAHSQDVGGPIARTVTDVALLMDVIKGRHPVDSRRFPEEERAAGSFVAALAGANVRGLRFGLLTAFFGDMPDDAEAGTIVRAAAAQLKTLGAEIVDIEIPGLPDLLRSSGVIDAEFKFDLADYLEARRAPVGSLGAILERGLYHEDLEATFRRRNAAVARETPAYLASLAKRDELRKAALSIMDAEKLTALIYPASRRKAGKIGEAQPGGGNCQLSAHSGLPALVVPAGFTPDGMPVGIEWLGRPFDDGKLLAIGFAYEQAARVRRAPPATPPLAPGYTPPRAEKPPANAGPPGLAGEFTRSADGRTLTFDVRVIGFSPTDVIAAALHRGSPETPGPVIAPLLTRGRTTGKGEILIRDIDRADITSGNIYMELYTTTQPLGTARTKVIIR